MATATEAFTEMKTGVKPTTDREAGSFHGLSNEQVAERLKLDEVIRPDKTYAGSDVERRTGIDEECVSQAILRKDIRSTLSHCNPPCATGESIAYWIGRMGIEYSITPLAARIYRSEHREVDATPLDLLDMVDQARKDAAAKAEREAAEAAAIERRRHEDGLAEILSRYKHPAEGDAVTLGELMDVMEFDATKVRKLLSIIERFNQAAKPYREAIAVKATIAPLQAQVDELLLKHATTLAEVEVARAAVKRADAGSLDKATAKVEALIKKHAAPLAEVEAAQQAVASARSEYGSHRADRQLERAQSLRDREPWLFNESDTDTFPTLKYPS